MRSPKRALDLAALLPVGAVLLFVPPYVRLADGAGTLLGIPSLHFYIFGVWGVGIVLTALVARRLSALEDAASEPEAWPADRPAGDVEPPGPSRSDGDEV